MSWIFGLLGPENPSFNNGLHEKPLVVFNQENKSIAAGGIAETCLFSPEVEGNKGWIVAGTGIQRMSGNDRIVIQSDWDRIAGAAGPIRLRDLDGHFAIVRWNETGVDLFVDQLGLRSFYFATHRGGVCFSTRLDWVAKFTTLHDIDFGTLGSRWLLFNQLSYRSGVKGIQRLGPGGHVRFEHGAMTEYTPYESWQPSDLHTSLKEQLRSLLRIHHDRPVSLGLSGGIDSRTLLSLLSNNPASDFSTHTFGSGNDPDVSVSKSICENMGIKQTRYDESLLPPEEVRKAVGAYVAQTMFIEPASSILKLRYYPFIHSAGRRVIDGGFGEIARRQYLNRLLRFGKRALASQDFGVIRRLLHVYRAECFSRDVVEEMERGIVHDLQLLWNDLPSIKDFGIENLVDLLAVRTRFPNYGGPEQARFDSIVLNLMPFAQPSVLHAMFATPVHQRRHGGMFRTIIRQHSPKLLQFPLAKGGTTYPFRFSGIPALLYIRGKALIRSPYRDASRDELLVSLEDFVRDTARSSEVTSCEAYSHVWINDTIERYYSGDRSLGPAVDWWITFELWRRSLRNS